MPQHGMSPYAASGNGILMLQHGMEPVCRSTEWSPYDAKWNGILILQNGKEFLCCIMEWSPYAAAWNEVLMPQHGIVSLCRNMECLLVQTLGFSCKWNLQQIMIEGDSVKVTGGFLKT